MTPQKIITSLAVFSLVVILPLSSFIFGSHRVLAQVCVDGAGYYDGSGMWCSSSQDGSDPSCTYESCPSSTGTGSGSGTGCGITGTASCSGGGTGTGTGNSTGTCYNPASQSNVF